MCVYVHTRASRIIMYCLLHSGVNLGITSDGFFELEDLPK